MIEPAFVYDCPCGKRLTGYSKTQLVFRKFAHEQGRKHKLYS